MAMMRQEQSLAQLNAHGRRVHAEKKLRGKPRAVRQLQIGPPERAAARIVDELRGRPYDIIFVAGGWQFRT
ncbi:hypothetical protein [Methylosinus sp. KRF6]|uniref:hypothetical protein n=1 Tax=Methylosinus sp. KRF6 TaxID=2846853 RepID=UPI001C0CB015|nr:hypothetical protein [Methylosinus sp. KRF6]MBU3887999.1 hypothetical protein [Methylosinus sp. KRF6]